MKNEKQTVHFVDKYLLAPTNPVRVALIGAGGTGSQFLTSLLRMHISLIGLGHPGLHIQLFDDDVIQDHNRGRQLFAKAEVGMTKSVALISRANRFAGTNWKAVQTRIGGKNKLPSANITISCVDTVDARFEIAMMLKENARDTYNRNRPMYWLDFGNSRDSGQAILSTVSEIKQPESKRFRTQANLPFVTDEYKELWQESENPDEPSCSLAESFQRQDLFVNTGLSALGSSLLWRMFREGMLRYRGFFMNLEDFRIQPIPITKTSKK